jgi:hypothetical protein
MHFYEVALAAAIISFGWLAWQVEEARRKETAPPAEPAAAAEA